jgi:hypothetical protein
VNVLVGQLCPDLRPPDLGPRSQSEWPDPGPPQTEQERIAYLRDQPIPDGEGSRFADEVIKNGNIFDLDVTRESDGVPFGTARGGRPKR